MTRSLLVPLTGVVVTLAVLLQNIWLYAAGGVALLLLLVLLVGYLWRRFSRDDSDYPSSYEEAPSQPSLEDLGITEIRPKNKNAPAPTERPRGENRNSDEKDSSSSSGEPAKSSTLEAGGGLESTGPARETVSSGGEVNVSTAARRARSTESNGSTATESDERVDEPRAAESDPDDGSPEDGGPAGAEDPSIHAHTESRPLGLDAAEIVRPHLEALRASIHAQTVCLIGLQGESEGYRVEASLSRSPSVATGTVIEADRHFLRSVAPDEPVTILVAEGEGPTFEDLGYYGDDVPVGQVAVSPVRTERGVVAYLLADRPKDAPAVPASHYRLLARSAELLGHMIDVRAEERPRREIIAVEMERAREEGRPLALALVHPIDAEAISAHGPGAVREEEARLERLLADSTGRGRIERFGELIYGVFYYDPEDTVEAWAQQVQEAFSEADWAANMGVAICSDRHEEPEDLRGDATEALRVAYEAGENECIIFE